MEEKTKHPDPIITEEGSERYELDKDFCLSKEDEVKQLSPNKITLYSVNLKDIQEQIASKYTLQTEGESTKRKKRLAPLGNDYKITDFHLYKGGLPTTRHVQQRSVNLYTRYPATQISTHIVNQNLTTGNSKKNLPNICNFLQVVDQSASPERSHKRGYSMKTLLNPKTTIEVIGGSESIANSIQNMRQSSDLALSLPIIHSNTISNQPKLITPRTKKQRQSSGFVYTKVLAKPKANINLNDCIKPVVDPTQKRIFKALGTLLKS